MWRRCRRGVEVCDVKLWGGGGVCGGGVEEVWRKCGGGVDEVLRCGYAWRRCGGGVEVWRCGGVRSR